MRRTVGAQSAHPCRFVADAESLAWAQVSLRCLPRSRRSVQRDELISGRRLGTSGVQFRAFFKLFAPSNSLFSSHVFDAFTPLFIVQSPGTPRLRHSPHTSQRHSTIFLAAYRLMPGFSPLLSSLTCHLRPSTPYPSSTRNILRPQCTLLSGRAHLGRGRTVPTPPFLISLSVFAPRQWPSRVDTPLAMSPLTGNGYGQVSPGAALVRLREASVSVDTPAIHALPRFWSV